MRQASLHCSHGHSLKGAAGRARTQGLPQKVDFHTLASAPCPISSPSTGRTMPPAPLAIFVELSSWECDIFGHHAPLAVGLVRVTRCDATESGRATLMRGASAKERKVKVCTDSRVT